jgi:alkylated DNA nucleotide flippase Atl1
VPKSAIDQLKAAKEPHIVSPIPLGFPGAMTANSMLVSTPCEVDAVIKRVPAGKLVTLAEIRAHLAQRHGAEIACPVSTAIFINVAARAAEEYAAMGEEQITPYWRVLKVGGKLNEKYPGGIAAQRERLEAEGFTVLQRRKGAVVAEYEQFLFAL